MTGLTMDRGSIIAAWHEETRKVLGSQIGTDQGSWTEIDELCACVVSVSADYCAAIMRLLHDRHEWPAKALMRCLGEVNAKFTWCLVGCGKDDTDPKAVTERIQRWVKTACSEGIKLLDQLDGLVQPEDRGQHDMVQNNLKEREKSLAVKNMPDLKQIFEQLGSLYYDAIRPVFYSRFNNAVHLDPSTLSAVYADVTEGCAELARYCAAYACNVNSLIRLRYGCPVDDIQEEFRQM